MKKIIFGIAVGIILFMGCNSLTATKSILKCKIIPGLDTLLKPGNIILLGEIHGTREGPGYVNHFVCNSLQKKLKVTIGLELPKIDQSVINAFLQSNGDATEKNKIINLPFWSRDYQDGRASHAMLELLESMRQLKGAGEMIEVLLIDDESSSDRDHFMAQNVIQAAQTKRDHLIIILTGNYHNMINEGGGHMGSLVLAQLGNSKVISLVQSYTGGSAWVCLAGEECGPVRLRGDGRKDIGIFMFDEVWDYNGTLEVDSIHVSRPAKSGGL